jgi:hydrogenase maturation protease
MSVGGGADDRETVVIGVGSPLMGDDGLGLRALEAIRDRYEFEPPVEFLDGGTWGMNLLPFIESAGRVLILDAIEAGKQPGTVVELEGDALPRFFSMKLSPHQIDLREVLGLAELRGRLPDVVALGLQPGKVELAAELSPDVRGGLPPLMDAAVDRLATWGHRVRPRAPAGEGR